jgi:hypothetical protein
MGKLSDFWFFATTYQFKLLERFGKNCSYFKGRALLPQRRRRSSAALPGIGYNTATVLLEPL